MGSLDKYCRLCATNVRPDQLLKLYEVGVNTEDINNVVIFVSVEFHYEFDSEDIIQ